MKCVVLVGVVATLSGCSFPVPPRAGQEDPDAPTSGEDGRQGDAGRLDGPPCTPGYINLCDVTARTDVFTLSASTTINTSNDVRCIVKAQANGPYLCILYFARVDIPAGVTVTATGTRALVLASTTTLNIAGTLDVGSRRTRAERGAASNHSTCTFNASPENDAGGGGGGAGGTFATQGGSGGTGDLNDDNAQGGSASPGTPGAAVAVLPAVLRGGCPGQRGGNGLGAGGAIGGASGGAVYLFAKAALTISGRVQATGSGGTGASARNGGGGAGSGGVIVIESETQSSLSGVFLATGGGGGEGGGAPVTGMDEGKSGEDATSLNAAPGGSDITGGGDGGAGATYSNGSLVQAVTGMVGDGGGGGGGGGNGFIAVRGAGRMLTGAFAPLPLQSF